MNHLFFPEWRRPGLAANNCYSTNERAARVQYAEEFIARGMAATAEALRSLLMNNTTGLMKDLVAGHDFKAEIKLISSITLNELLGPFDMVDYLESDIQQSEILVFPPFIDLLRRKVRPDPYRYPWRGRSHGTSQPLCREGLGRRLQL